jgi:hypothetical protein
MSLRSTRKSARRWPGRRRPVASTWRWTSRKAWPNKVFTLTPTDRRRRADVMRLTGDQDVRIDFTNPANQITGLDLDGDGTHRIRRPLRTQHHVGCPLTVALASKSSTLTSAQPAEPRRHRQQFPWRHLLRRHRLQAGDGVETDGNIFLGGLGTGHAPSVVSAMIFLPVAVWHKAAPAWTS